MVMLLKNKVLITLVAAMIAIVVASNYLVQFPVQVTIAGYNLADILTWGAFTYPAAFLVTDLTNRAFGPSKARIVVIIGFAAAVVLSALLAPVRIAIASGTAFLMAQLLDVYVFNELRGGRWWRAPVISSTLGSIIDTALFFSLAFAASFAMLGESVPFLVESAPLLGLFATEVPRWVSLAGGDFVVKMLVALVMLVPYGLLRNKVAKVQPA